MSRRSGLKTPLDNHHTLIRRCLAIVLSRLSNPGLSNGDVHLKSRTRSRKDSSISLDHEEGHRVTEGPGPPLNFDKCLGPDVFGDLVRENSECYWNPCLVQSVRSLEYRGCVAPATLLVAGTEYSLEVVRSAWARRMLRPPNGFDILMLGDLDTMHMTVVAQTQFAPLPEALCKVVYDLNSEGAIATLAIISSRLRSTFPELVVPSENILYRALGTLIRERKLYHTGHGYSVVTPDTFRLLAMSPPLERQMLLTNEEAIVRLHGTSTHLSSEEGDTNRTACTQTNQKDMLTTWSSAERILAPSRQSLGKLKRCHSLKLLRGKDKEKLSRCNSFRSSRGSPVPNREAKSDPENHDPIKKEKASMFSKLFRRGRSDKSQSKVPKCATFSSQFPPRDWTDPDYVHFNSRATQTLDREPPLRNKSRSSSLNRVSSRERHSLHLTPTPVTPRSSHRSTRLQSSDIYHYRSSSLPRKSSPSPTPAPRNSNSHSCANRKTSSPKPSPRVRQQQPPQCQVPTNTVAKTRPRYQSPFTPVTNRLSNGDYSLRAGEKYADLNTTTNPQTGNVLPYRPLSASLGAPQLKPPYNFLSRGVINQNGTSPWRKPSLTMPPMEQKVVIGEPMKKAPIVILPQRIVSREVASVPPSTAAPVATKPITRIITENIDTTETTAKFISPNKELHLGGTVDVEISMGPQAARKGLLNTDLDSESKKDLLKIAASWNHSISNNTLTGKPTVTKNPRPTLTTTTSITTSVSHGGAKDIKKAKTVDVIGPKESLTNSPVQVLKRSTIMDCSGNCTLLNELPGDTSDCNNTTPRSKVGDAKAAFFSESPSPTEPHLSKDDSGFSSSASTSRPMSVSPC